MPTHSVTIHARPDQAGFLKSDGDIGFVDWDTPGAGVTALTNGHIFVGDASNLAADVAMSGVIAISNTGVTSFGSFASSVLKTALTDETGSGVVVFNDSPTLITPVLGVATATSIAFTDTTIAGLRLNNLTAAQITALGSPAAGQAVWDTDAARLRVYNGATWTNGFVRIAGDTMTGQLMVDGSSDQIQLRVQGNATQTTNLVTFEASDGTLVAGMDSTGSTFWGTTAIASTVGHYFKDNLATRLSGAAFSRTLVNPAATRYAIQADITSTQTSGAYNLGSVGFYISSYITASNTQNWTGNGTTGTQYGLGGAFIHIETRSGSAGTLTVGQNLIIETQFDSMTVTNWWGVAIKDPTGTGTLTNAIGIKIQNITKGATLNYALQSGKGLIIHGDAVQVTGWQDVQQLLVTGHTTQAVGTSMVKFIRNDTAAGVSRILSLVGLGSGAAGDGVLVRMAAKSSTTADTDIFDMQPQWATATHASRKGRVTFNVWDTASREAIRIEASGTAPMIGLFGVNAVVQPAGATQAAPAAYATGAFGLDSDAHMQALYDLVVAMRTALVNTGIIKGAA